MRSITRYIHHHHLALVALFFALSGGVAYAANTIASTDIIDGQVKQADVGEAAVGSNELKNNSILPDDVAPNSLGTGRIADGTLTGTDVANNSLKGADIDESSLSLDFQGTAKVVSKRTSFPVNSIPPPSGRQVLNVPGFGEVRAPQCGGKTVHTSFRNNTNETVDVFAAVSRIVVESNDPVFESLAPGQELVTESDLEGKEHATYQVGSASGGIATITVMGRGGTPDCHFHAQATISG